MYFLIKDNELLGKLMRSETESAIIFKKGFDIEPAHNEKYSKTKTKSYEGKINTNFCNDKVLKEGSHFICRSVALIDSVFKMGKNYYSQVFLEEYKYTAKEEEVTRHFAENLEISSDSDESDEK